MTRRVMITSTLTLCSSLALTNVNQLHAQTSVFERFITASDGRLMDGERELRFISFNIPNLNYVEDEMDFVRPHPYRLPDEFEIRDALESVRQMGGRVVRLYTIPVRRQHDPPDLPTYVLGPDEFDETSFQTMDLVLALANEMGVRLIVPLLNNWQWMGGRPQYAAFRGKSADEFWTDRQLIDDFKRTVRFVVTRRNTITGVRYRDDKAILCWETGNELMCPHAWTHEIARHIKSLDPNHLLMDGYHAIDCVPVRDESLTDSHIDIVHSHHYDPHPDRLLRDIRRNLAIVRGRKPYILGEFGFIGIQAVERVLDEVIRNRISGALVWSLRFHRREGGFYWHSEPFGRGLFKAYHWPGFESGAEYDERRLLALMRKKAHDIQNRLLPRWEAPREPTLLPIDDVSRISWRGSTGAESYIVERASGENGPWEIIADRVSDAGAPYVPLFHDISARIGGSHYYRVRASNDAGMSSPSNVVGPVKVTHRTFVDDMRSLIEPYDAEGVVTVASDDDRRFREAMYRRHALAGAEILYYIPGRIQAFRVHAFSGKSQDPLTLIVSKDGERPVRCEQKRELFSSGPEDYAYWMPILYSGACAEDARYLRVLFREEAQLARVEIVHAP